MACLPVYRFGKTDIKTERIYHSKISPSECPVSFFRKISYHIFGNMLFGFLETTIHIIHWNCNLNLKSARSIFRKTFKP